MDYKEKVIALLNSQELSKEQKEKLENIFPELKESEDKIMRKAIIQFTKENGYKYTNYNGRKIAKEEALKAYPPQSIAANYDTIDRRDAFEYGYLKAEKDLELTLEDMRKLYIIFAEVDTEIELGKTDITAETIGYYQEVLKRFKERKEK